MQAQNLDSVVEDEITVTFGGTVCDRVAVTSELVS